ncbi:MAG: hypothetical protein IIC25_08280 [Chloroflexi bacterium]|nr:hypothetical protein [Chloroflexota bacterium]
MPNVVDIVTTGALFRLGGAPLDAAIKASIVDIVARGEELVKRQLYVGHGVVSGHYRRSIHGVLQDSRHGLIHDSNVIYGSWLEGTSSRNQTTRFKGYSMFRRATQQLNREKGRIVNGHIARAARTLNGA